MSFERLQLNLLSFFEKGLLPDVTIMAQGREIRAHKAILAAQSEWFCQQFQASTGDVVEVPQKYKVVKLLIRFMYFGGVQASSDLGPDDALDLLLLAQDLQVNALGPVDIMPLILPRLTMQNCLSVLQHEGLQSQPTLQAGVAEFVGKNFLAMLPTMEQQMLGIPRNLLAVVLRSATQLVCQDTDCNRLVQFCLSHTQLDSACDLLRETKQWNWGGDQASLLRAPPQEEPYEGPEWCIEGVRAAMESTPARIVVGTFFDWCIRLDYGAEGKLRIVYESATPREDVDARRCINRFPAAMFAWRVLYRGQDVFNEKPVFICFPENVSLHWSTTLPVTAADLADDDELRIMVNMAENPMLSIVLYYFSSDLKTTVFSEDILNRLPHIEYRCLSSYSLVKTHVEQT
eukprot:gnl/TRDRNA2_/TRDRNA2_186063_c0_seq1.p1 gnl/TRDRNA2_/TRDRNA2_186063_c0~~gnl/TRDRNA2_/TRDRNA2_186063_c0_seq1.p1  ORF type:complete len:438 (-),score=81.04 gnl/TRDRNA2_/TRDRNA2_186063_c0_seq1:65-1270(-)